MFVHAHRGRIRSNTGKGSNRLPSSDINKQQGLGEEGGASVSASDPKRRWSQCLWAKTKGSAS